jgi:hypothetical protein
MQVTRWGAVLAGLSLPASALAQAGAERLASPPLSGFIHGYQAANAQQAIREEVPRGETVERWTRMVTTQRFGGLASRATPAAYARTIAASAPQAARPHVSRSIAHAIGRARRRPSFFSQ